MKRFLITYCAGLLLALMIHSVRADSIQLHVASEHADGCTECNEENWGVGYMGSGDGARLVAGYYTNSWFRDSFYAGANWKIFTEHTSVSLVGVTGYEGTTDGAKEVIVVPLLHIKPFPRADVTPMITYAPTRDGGVALFSLSWRM